MTFKQQIPNILIKNKKKYIRKGEDKFFENFIKKDLRKNISCRKSY